MSFLPTGSKGNRETIQTLNTRVDEPAQNVIDTLVEAGFYDNYYAGYRYHGAYCSGIFDCTNTSTHKVRFATDVQDSDSNVVRWHQPHMRMTFIKLADT